MRNKKETPTEQSAFLSNLKKELADLAGQPYNVGLQRQIVSNLVRSLPELEDRREFLVALTYKLFLDDLLRNSMEDDYVCNKTVDESVRCLASAILPYCKNKREKYIEALLRFAQVYRQIPLGRHQLDEIEIEYNDINALICVPTLKAEKIYIGDGHDWPAFANLDNNLADPRRSSAISKWYINVIKELIKAPEGKGINILTFIQKEYSGVGALALMPTLVSELKIPATVYRAGYWDKGSRITGENPLSGTEGCIVYDAAIGGNAIIETNSFLEKEYGLRNNYAVVFFEYDSPIQDNKLMAYQALKDNGIKLISCFKYSEVSDQIEPKQRFVKRMRELSQRYLDGNQKASRTKIDEALKDYVASIHKE